MKDKQSSCTGWMKNFPVTTPFQWLSAYNILRGWQTYQLRHIQVEGRSHKAEWMWFYVGLLRIPDVNESNDEWYDECQRTQPYSINVEPNEYRVSEVCAIRAYYPQLHDGAIRNLSTVKHRIRNRRFCSRERTTNAASIWVVSVVNMAKK